jgi:hypothetical protein
LHKFSLTTSNIGQVDQHHHTDLIIEYSFEDHREKPLSTKLEEVRQAIDIDKEDWVQFVRVEDASTHKLMQDDFENLPEVQFPVAVKWVWFQKSDLAKPSRRRRIRFYWKGLVDNSYLRAILLRMKSRLSILSRRADALVHDMVGDEERMGTKSRRGVDRSFSCSLDDENDLDIGMAKDTLRGLEALLAHRFEHKSGKPVRTDELFQMAGCPFDDFLEIYIRDRNCALKEDGRHQRRETVEVMVRAIDMIEVMCGYLESRIDANDQMLFKVFLFVVNIVSCVSQFVYEWYIMPHIEALTDNMGLD